MLRKLAGLEVLALRTTSRRAFVSGYERDVARRAARERTLDERPAQALDRTRALVAGVLGWSGNESVALPSETAHAEPFVAASGGGMLTASNVVDPRQATRAGPAERR